jgi:peptide/nickel transport system substrate-binding protein
MLRQRRPILAACATVALLLAGCVTRTVTVTVTTTPKTVVVTATPSPSPLPTPSGPKVLTVCLVGEPDTLYLYGGSRLPATRHVQAALYDGPIDYLNYTYQPVILQKVPTIANGGAVTRTVHVQEGDRVVDATGEVVELDEGVQIRPTGCYDDECVVEFEGEPLRMERLEVTFVLKKGLTWADGEPLTAADSVFAFQVASDPDTPGNRYLTDRTTDYRYLDGQRVKWYGVPGFAPLDYPLSFFAPLPQHQLERRSPAELLEAEETRRYPLGWGPFVVREWVPGDRITLTRNPYYFRADEGLPYLEQVVFRFTSGAPEVVAGLLAGECDIGTQDADFESLMPMVVEAEQRGLLEVISAPGNEWEHVEFGIDPVSSYRQADFFEDVRVRHAIVQCIDRRAIVDEVAYGRSVVPDSYLPPVHPLYAGGQLAPWDYDPTAGQALLEEVGWMDEDEDGVREARNIPGVRSGTPFEITLLTSSDSSVSQQVAHIVKAHLADCGIRVNLEAVPSQEFLADGPKGPLFGRQFDLAETAWWFGLIPPCEHYLSREIPDRNRWGGSNPSGYSNPEYDAACQAALQALPGSPGYERDHKEAQVIFSEELPAIPLFVRPQIALAREGVLNFTLDSTAESDLWNIEELDVK